MKEYSIGVVADAAARIHVFAKDPQEALSKATREMGLLYPSNFIIKDVELDIKSLEEITEDE